jgi:hypothetical protein
MAVCLVMQFAGMDTAKYEAVKEELGKCELAKGHDQSRRRIR